MAEPKWMEIAKSYVGTKEKVGKAANPQIVEWYQAAGSDAKEDSIPWCSAFVHGVMEADVRRRVVNTTKEAAMAEPEWMEIAKSYVGTKEKIGKASNPQIVEWYQAAGSDARDDSVPWCSAFVHGVMEEAGMKGTMSLAARSWLRWGKATEPKPGAILIFSRGTSSWQGHVGFYAGETPTHYEVLGGNQGDAVSIRGYSKSRLLGARWPSTMGKSRTVKAAAIGGMGSGASFLIEQFQEAKYVTEGLQDYVSWAGYAAAALAVICFVLVAWFRWTDMRDKGL